MTHRVLGYREWTDEVRIGVEVGESEEKAFITFTMASSTWLDYVTVQAEVIPWLKQCAGVVADFNKKGYERRLLEVPSHEGRRVWLGNDDFVLACGCEVGCTFLDRGARVDVMKPGPHLRKEE